MIQDRYYQGLTAQHVFNSRAAYSRVLNRIPRYSALLVWFKIFFLDVTHYEWSQYSTRETFDPTLGWKLTARKQIPDQVNVCLEFVLFFGCNRIDQSFFQIVK